jgi:large subunit ribosomal protein L13
MQANHPGRALEKAVKGMLPKGPLGYAMIKKLKVYAGAEHPHSAQQPKVLDIAGVSNNAVKAAKQGAAA